DVAARSATIEAAICERRSSLDTARDDPEPVEGPAIGTSLMLEAQTRAEAELHAADVSRLRGGQHVDVHRCLREAHEAARADANAVVLPHDVGRVRADVVAGLALLARQHRWRDGNGRTLLAAGRDVTHDILLETEERRTAVDQDVELLVDRHDPSDLHVDRFLLAIETGNRLIKGARAVEDNRARNGSGQSALGVVLLLMIGDAEGQ